MDMHKHQQSGEQDVFHFFIAKRKFRNKQSRQINVNAVLLIHYQDVFFIVILFTESGFLSSFISFFAENFFRTKILMSLRFSVLFKTLVTKR